MHGMWGLESLNIVFENCQSKKKNKGDDKVVRDTWKVFN